MSRMSFYSFELEVIKLFYGSPFKCYIHRHTPHVYGWRSSLRGEAREQRSEVGFVNRCLTLHQLLHHFYITGFDKRDFESLEKICEQIR
jgi:hypothetical protein